MSRLSLGFVRKETKPYTIERFIIHFPRSVVQWTLIENQLVPVIMCLLRFKETFIERILMAVFFGVLFVLGTCWWWSFRSVVTSHIRFNSCINTAADTSYGNWRNCAQAKVWSDQQGLGSSNWYPCFLILIFERNIQWMYSQCSISK